MSVLPFAEAFATVLTHAKSLTLPATETVPLETVDGRILAAPVIAPRDHPPFDRSTRDGYAIRTEDVRNPLLVIGQLRAGELWSNAALAANEAIEIMTGAPVPAGADAVVMIEYTTLNGSTLAIDAARHLRRGENIVPRRAEARAGATVLPIGRALHAAEIAVAASCGAATLSVFHQPSVAILATGDELVEVGGAHEVDAAQIYNSNSYAIASLVRDAGALAERLPIARDNRGDLDARLSAAAQHDLLLLSGGVSMGKFDLVEEALAARGAEFFFTGALIQPGKPIVFGKLTDGPYFFGLPGNPVSAQVCFHLFVAPLLRALGGATQLESTFVEARLEHEVKPGPNVLRFVPAELSGSYEAASVRLVGWQGSGDLSANARGNSYAVLPIGEHLAAGTTIRVLLR